MRSFLLIACCVLSWTAIHGQSGGPFSSSTLQRVFAPENKTAVIAEILLRICTINDEQNQTNQAQEIQDIFRCNVRPGTNIVNFLQWSAQHFEQALAAHLTVDQQQDLMISAFIYMHRAMQRAPFMLDSFNVHRFFIAAILEALKMRFERPRINRYVAQVFTNGDVEEVADMERAFLQMLDYKLVISKLDWHRYLYDLSSQSGQDHLVHSLTVLFMHSNGTRLD